MDHVAFPLVFGGLATVVATAYGVLPERIDLTFVFAAYGAGSIIGEAVAARHPGPDAPLYARRWGATVMLAVGLFWALGLLLHAVR